MKKSVHDQQYSDKRLKFLAEQKAAGINPYPHKFSSTMSITDFIKTYGELDNEDRVQDMQVSLAGRIISKRSNSSNFIFYDLYGAGGKVQVMADARTSELDETQFSKLHDSVKRRDIVGVTGCPGKSKRGELSIFPKSFVVLSHCLHLMPMENSNVKKSESWVPGCPRDPESYILKDQETRYGMRFLDMIMNGEVREIFKTRANVISYIRRFLDNLDFLEVETPILDTIPSVGAALPFVASNNELKMKLYMRIAPELYLKQLVVGVLDRVYEIGKQFRCENIDMTHHPEFTTCEFYMAYAATMI